MELSEIINEIEHTKPEDAKLTLCFMLGFLSEKPDIWHEVSSAYEYSPTRLNKALSAGDING